MTTTTPAAGTSTLPAAGQTPPAGERYEGRSPAGGHAWRIGSLCSGYEGLGMAVQSVLGGELAWVADNDPGAAAILAHRFPSVPNHGDITVTDWASVEPVDILTAGFPCQPVSSAGQRKGLSDERWLFDDICSAIGRMVTRPRLLVLENVPGLLSANGGDAMERVIQGLAALGYVGRYRLLRASDAGAPHRRERVFITAWPAADAERDAVQRWGVAGVLGGTQQAAPGILVERESPERQRERHGHATADRHQAAPSHADSAAGGERGQPASGQAESGRSRADAGRRSGAPAADADGAQPGPDGGGSGTAALAGPGERARRGSEPGSAVRGGTPADSTGNGRHEGRPEPARLIGGSDAAVGRDGPAADAHGAAWRRHEPGSRPGTVQGAAVAERAQEQPGRCGGGGGDAGTVAWGQFGPAIARWETILRRPAPRPTEPGRTGERLALRFVEWLMGLPAGWVTDVPGLSRNAQLKALGNGVVPAQAALALSLLLSQARSEVAA